MGDKLDSVIDSSVAALVGIILLCAVVIPTSVSMIGGLTGDAEQFKPLLYAVLTIACVGLVIGIIRFYQNGGSKSR